MNFEHIEIVPSGYEIKTPLNREEILLKFEDYGRECYDSHDKVAPGSAAKFCRMIKKRGHLGVFEHHLLSVKFTTTRAIANQMVRHRLASYLQTSTRYVDASKGGKMQFIDPTPYISERNALLIWVNAMDSAARQYKLLRVLGVKPELARGVLPLDLKTTIIVSKNLRAWSETLETRTSKAVHPHFLALTRPLLHDLQQQLPEVFGEADASQV